MYIIFEGIDGVGKSTQAQLMKSHNEKLILTFEPGATILGKSLRNILLDNKKEISTNAEFFLFLADRAEHFTKIIEPNLDKTIISDRGFISGIAYALASNESLDFSFLFEINKFALNNHLPDKIVFFEANKDLLFSRLNRSHDKIESRGFRFLIKVQENMKKIIQELKIECLKIDASQDIDTIHKKIKGFIND